MNWKIFYLISILLISLLAAAFFVNNLDVELGKAETLALQNANTTTRKPSTHIKMGSARTRPTTKQIMTNAYETTTKTTRMPKPKVNKTGKNIISDFDFKLNNRCLLRNKTFVDFYATVEERNHDRLVLCQAVFVNTRFLIFGRDCVDDRYKMSDLLIRPFDERYIGWEFNITYISSFAGDNLGLIEIDNDVPIDLETYACILENPSSSIDYNFLAYVDTTFTRKFEKIEYVEERSDERSGCMPRHPMPTYFAHHPNCSYVDKIEIKPYYLSHRNDTLLFGYKNFAGNNSLYIEGAYFEDPFGETSQNQTKLYLLIQPHFAKLEKFLKIRKEEFLTSKLILPNDRRANLDIPEPPPPPPPKPWYIRVWRAIKSFFTF